MLPSEPAGLQSESLALSLSRRPNFVGAKAEGISQKCAEEGQGSEEADFTFPFAARLAPSAPPAASLTHRERDRERTCLVDCLGLGALSLSLVWLGVRGVTEAVAGA